MIDKGDMPKPHVRIADDESLVFEWRGARGRLTIIFDKSANDSGWHFVLKGSDGFGYGSLDTLTPDVFVDYLQKVGA